MDRTRLVHGRMQHVLGPYRVTVDGASINVLSWGERDRPGLVFVHGGAAYAHWWSHIAPMFLPDYRVVAIDLSGHGDSDRRSRLLVAGMDRRGAAVIDNAAFAEPPVVIGHSMGGFVTIATAAWQADMIGSAVIIDSPVVATLRWTPRSNGLVEPTSSRRRRSTTILLPRSPGFGPSLSKTPTFPSSKTMSPSTRCISLMMDVGAGSSTRRSSTFPLITPSTSAAISCPISHSSRLAALRARTRHPRHRRLHAHAARPTDPRDRAPDRWPSPHAGCSPDPHCSVAVPPRHLDAPTALRPHLVEYIALPNLLSSRSRSPARSTFVGGRSPEKKIINGPAKTLEMVRTRAADIRMIVMSFTIPTSG